MSSVATAAGSSGASPVMLDPSSPGQLAQSELEHQPISSNDHGQPPVAARALEDDFLLVTTAEPVGDGHPGGGNGEDLPDATQPILQAAHVDLDQQAVDIHALARHVSEHKDRATICTGEDVVLLMGRTGTGKSTTMNWCMGKTVVETVADEADEYAMTVLAVDGEELAGCEIGQAGDSKTAFLQAYRTESGLIMCDTPGFKDTGGSNIDLSGSIAIMKLMKICKSVRIAVLINGGAIVSDPRCGPLSEILGFMKQFLREPAAQLDSVLYLFTHCQSTRPRQLLGQLNRMKQANCIHNDSEMLAMVDHMMKQLKEFEDRLIVDPVIDQREPIIALMNALKPIDSSQTRSPLTPDVLRDLISACAAADARVRETLYNDDLGPGHTLLDDLDALQTLSETVMVDDIEKIYHASCVAVEHYMSKVTQTARNALASGEMRILRVQLDKMRGFRQFDEHVDIAVHRTSWKQLLEQLNEYVAREHDLSAIESDYPAVCKRLDRLKEIQDNLTNDGGKSSPFISGKLGSGCYGSAVQAAIAMVKHDKDKAATLIGQLHLDGVLGGVLTGLALIPSTNLGEHCGTHPGYSGGDLYSQLVDHLEVLIQHEFERAQALVPTLNDRNKDEVTKIAETLRVARYKLEEHVSSKTAGYHDKLAHGLTRLEDSCFAEIDALALSHEYAQIPAQFEQLRAIESVKQVPTTERHRLALQSVGRSITAVSESVDALLKIDSLREHECQILGKGLHTMHDAACQLKGVLSADIMAWIESEYTSKCDCLVSTVDALTARLDDNLDGDPSVVSESLAQLEIFLANLNHESISSRSAGYSPSWYRQIVTKCQQGMEMVSCSVIAVCNRCSELESQHPLNSPDAATSDAIAQRKDTVSLLNWYRDYLRDRSAELPRLAALPVHVEHPESEYDTADEIEEAEDLLKFIATARPTISTFDRLMDQVDVACKVSSDGLRSAAEKLQCDGIQSIEDGTSSTLSGHHFAKCQSLLQALDRLVDLDELADGRFMVAHGEIVVKLNSWLKEHVAQFRVHVKADRLEEAQHIMGMTQHMLVLKQWMDTAEAEHTRMCDDIAEKTESFSGRVNDLLLKNEFDKLGQVMRGQAALTGAQEQGDYEAAQKQIKNWFDQEYTHAIQILESLSTKRKLSGHDQVRELMVAMGSIERSEPLSDVIGRAAYLQCQELVDMSCAKFLEGIAEKATKYVSKWNFPAAEESRCDLESFLKPQTPETVRALVLRHLQAVDDDAEKRFDAVFCDLDEFVVQCDVHKINKMLDGLKLADTHDLEWPIGASDKFSECLTRLRARLSERCIAIRAKLESWDYQSARDELKSLSLLMSSAHSHAVLPQDEYAQLEQHLHDLPAEIISDRGFRADATKLEQGLRGLYETDSRAFRREMNKFVDSQKVQARAVEQRLVNLDGDCAPRCDSELERLQKYALIIGKYDQMGCSEIITFVETLFEELVKQVEECSFRFKAASRSQPRDWVAMEKYEAFLTPACAIIQGMLDPLEAKSDPTISLKRSLIDRAGRASVEALKFVQKNAHTVGAMGTVYDEIMGITPGTVVHDEFEPELVGTKLRNLKDNDAALATRMGASVDTNVSYSSAMTHVIGVGAKLLEDLRDVLSKSSVVNIGSMIAALTGMYRILETSAFTKDDKMQQECSRQFKKMDAVLSSLLDQMVQKMDHAYKTAKQHSQSDPCRFDAFNKDLEHMRKVEAAFSQLPENVREHLTTKLNDYSKQVIEGTVISETETKLQQVMQRLKASDELDYYMIAQEILALYMVPSNVSDMEVKTHAEHCINKIIDHCYTLSKKNLKSGVGTDFSELGRQLVQTGARGGEIVEQFPQFQTFRNEKFQLATAKITPEYALTKMSELNGWRSNEIYQMKTLFERFENRYDDYMKQSTYVQPADYVTRVVEAVKSAAATGNFAEAVAGICAIWSLGDCTGGKFQQTLLKPHPVQIMAIFKLLGLEQNAGSIAKLRQWVRSVDWLSATPLAADPGALKSQLIQLKTGEGKSVLLGVLATLLALLDFGVDVVCYSQYLSGRDQKAFAPVFDAFGVSGMITFGTFSELAEKTINARGNVRNMAAGVISKRPVTLPARDLKPKVLLIDEVDVFFSEDFYGATYNPITFFRTEETDALQKYMWTHRRSSSKDSLVRGAKSQSAYTKLIESHPDLRGLVDKSLAAMARDAVGVGAKMPPSGQQHHLVGGRIGYICNQQLEFDTFCGYETLFAYMLEDEKAPQGTLEYDDCFGISVPCGHFSFAEMAKTPKPYQLILGVTGTLDCLTDFQEKIIVDDYHIHSRGLTPSIYGDSGLTFKEEEDVHIEPDYDQYARKIQEEIMQCTQKGGAILVFFKSEKELKQFQASGYGKAISNLQCVTAQTENVDHYVKQATRSESATLFPRVHGRGLDFICHDPTVEKQGGVRVLQTFLSAEKTEEVQIQGRTARQNNKGSYALVLLAEDLQREHGITGDELALQQKQKGMYAFLDARRKKRCDKRAGDQRAQVESAKARHKESIGFAAALRKSQRASVIAQIIEWS